MKTQNTRIKIYTGKAQSHLLKNRIKRFFYMDFDKLVFWSIVCIFVPIILGGIFTIIKNINLVSFNF